MWLGRYVGVAFQTDYHFGEYFSQGSLEISNKCQVVSAASLFAHDNCNLAWMISLRYKHMSKDRAGPTMYVYFAVFYGLAKGHSKPSRGEHTFR